MVRNKYSFVLLTIVICLANSVNAAVSSSIDRNPVRVNETFELTLHMESAPVDKPSLEGLPEDFEVIRSTNFFQRSTVNGETNTQAGWRFILKARREGIFTIPKFDLDGEKTQILQLTVLPPVSSTNVEGKQDAIRLTATVDFENVYVQQQILFTIRLYRAVQAQYASLTEPEMPEALLERLGEDRQYETDLNGVKYIVLERRYALFPQEPGEQTIKPVTFSAEVSDGAKKYSTLGRLRARTKPVSLSTKPIIVKVKPRPTKDNNWWLPAKNISLSDQWQPDPTEFRVGEPVTWSYTIQAQGLTATQLPELLPAPSTGLKFYPDTAKSESKSDASGIAGFRTQKVAVVPTESGLLTIPMLKLSWWNVTKDKAEEIILPPRTIEVLPSLNGQTSSFKKPIEENINKLEEVAEKSIAPITAETSDRESDTLGREAWKMIAITSLSLWILSTLYFISRRKIDAGKREAAIETKHQTQTRFKDISKACNKNSAIAAKQAILDWCSGEEDFESIHSLAALARKVGTGNLAAQLDLLERHLYSDDDESWQGKDLASALSELKSFKLKPTDDKPNDQLPPLNLTDL